MSDRSSAIRSFFERRLTERRDLAPFEIERLAHELAEHPQLWRDQVRHSAEQRYYTQLYRDHHLDVWLICWSGDQQTGLHDHDLSGGAVRIVEGELDEDRLVMGRSGIETTRHRAGDSFSFDSTRIHDVRHAETAPSVSLHLYSPPIWRMGYYEVGEDGWIARRSASYAHELKAS